MTDFKDEFHQCPKCGRRTRHRVSAGDLKLAVVLWCQSCFHVHMGTEATAAVTTTEKAA